MTLEHFGITLRSLWGHFGYVRVRFQKTHLPNRLKWFYATLRLTWSHFGSTLDSLWPYCGYMRMIWDHFWVTLGLGSLWSHFGVTLGIWCVYVPSGSLNLTKVDIFQPFFNDFIKPHFRCISHVYQMYVKCLSDLFDVCERYIKCIWPEATCINLSLWASSVFGFATSPRGFAPRWEHFNCTKVALGHFWVTCASLFGHFGTTLGSLWAYDAYMCL